MQEIVVIKSVEGHQRVENERNVLKQLQDRTPFLRPLVDEIVEPSTPTTIALKCLKSDLLLETVKKTLNRKELKHVCWSIVDALRVLHDENLVHTGMIVHLTLYLAKQGQRCETRHYLRELTIEQ